MEYVPFLMLYKLPGSHLKFHRLKPSPNFRIFWPSQLLYTVTLINFLAEFVSGGQFEDALHQSLLPVFVLLAKPESTVLIPAALLINLILSRLIRLFGPIKAVHLVPIYLTFGSVTYFHMVRFFFSMTKYEQSPVQILSILNISHLLLYYILGASRRRKCLCQRQDLNVGNLD